VPPTETVKLCVAAETYAGRRFAFRAALRGQAIVNATEALRGPATRGETGAVPDDPLLQAVIPKSNNGKTTAQPPSRKQNIKIPLQKERTAASP
jgi:hypothetical protein